MTLVGPYLIAQAVTSHLLAICVISRLMQICEGATVGTQFAVYMALSNLSYSAGAFIYAQFTTAAVWPLLAGCCAALTGGLIAWWLAEVRSHRKESPRAVP